MPRRQNPGKRGDNLILGLNKNKQKPKGGKNKMTDKKCVPYLVLLIGILLLLPVLGVTALAGFATWAVPIAVVLIGIRLLMKK
jgi:hypothetical protein